MIPDILDGHRPGCPNRENRREPDQCSETRHGHAAILRRQRARIANAAHEGLRQHRPSAFTAAPPVT
jgi:hypothetical protein